MQEQTYRWDNYEFESDEYSRGYGDAWHGQGFQGHSLQHDMQRWVNYMAGYDHGLNDRAELG